MNIISYGSRGLHEEKQKLKHGLADMTSTIAHDHVIEIKSRTL